MQDLDLENAMYVIGVFVFAAIFLNQYEAWRKMRTELKDARAQLAMLRGLDLVRRDKEVTSASPDHARSAERLRSRPTIGRA